MAQYKVYKYNNQIIIVPNKDKKELEGIGVIWTNKLNIETVTDPQGVKTKKAWMWLKGCGKTYINDSKILDLKDGTMIKVRLAPNAKCQIQSWEKF